MKIGTLVGHEPDVLVYSVDPKNWRAPGLKIGVEVEIENPKRVAINLPNLGDWWRMHEDGSLRDAGFELTLIDPLFGVDLTNALEALDVELKKFPSLVANYRTGLHIHVDSRNLEAEELKRLFILYALFERSMFNFVGDNRNLNNFCAPWSRISDHLDGVFSIFSETADPGDVRQTLKNTERYSALNCAALQKFGSIEFRHMQMTFDFKKIRDWINIIMSLYNAAKTESQYGPRLPIDELIKLASKGGMTQMAENIFPDYFQRFVDYKAIWEGVMLVQELSLEIEQTKRFSDKSSILKICPHSGQNPGYLAFLRNSSKESA